MSEKLKLLENTKNWFALGLLPLLLTAAMGCRLTDGYDGAGPGLSVNSLSLYADCKTQAQLATDYHCEPELFVPQSVNPDDLLWEIGSQNTCGWVSIDPASGELYGTPQRQDFGSCQLSFGVRSHDDPPLSLDETNHGQIITVELKVLGPEITISENFCPSFLKFNHKFRCELEATSNLEDGQYHWSLSDENQCSWAQINSVTGLITGEPSVSSIGSCDLVVNLELEAFSSATFRKAISVGIR